MMFNTISQQIQLQQYRGKDIFKDIVPLCESSWGVIQQVKYRLKLCLHWGWATFFVSRAILVLKLVHLGQ